MSNETIDITEVISDISRAFTCGGQLTEDEICQIYEQATGCELEWDPDVGAYVRK